jgi:hypothetical protein
MNNNYDREIPTIDLTDSKLSKNGKYVVAGSQGGGSTQEIEGNYLVDINITLNLNIGDKINPDTLKEVNKLLDKILKVKKIDLSSNLESKQ